MKKKLVGLSILLCTFVPAVLLAQAKAPEDLQSFVEKGMQDWHVPGAAVAVVSDKEVLFQQGFGETATQDGTPVNEHTIFTIASTTKAMVNAGIMILVDEEKVALDDLAIKYIPELHFGDAWLTQQITVRDLMTHRTGVGSTDFWTFGQYMPMDEQILMLRQVEPSASLRSRFQYQNTMYELLGLIIKNVSGQEWGDFLYERLWQPIGMNETYDARGEIASDKHLVQPYEYIDDDLVLQEWDFSPETADSAGSVFSSIHDMGRWAQFLLRDGVTDKGVRLISEAGIAEMFKPQMLIDRNDFYPSSQLTNPNWISYGLGWFQQDFQGRKIDFHTGSLTGLVAILGLDRENDLAVVVLANRDHAEMRHAILWHVMDQTSERDWNAEILDLYQGFEAEAEEQQQQADASRLQGTKPSLPIADYAGTYHNAEMGNIEISQAGNGLEVITPGLSFPLTHWHLDTFLAEREDKGWRFFMPFHIGANAKVSGVEMFGQTFDKVPEITE